MLQLTDVQLKKIFWALLSVLFIICLIVTPKYGITGDEVTQWEYGDYVWRYIKTFGADKSILTDPKVAETPLKYYGGFYDGIASMLIDIFKPKDEFLLRHYWNIVFGFTGIVFGGLLAKEVANWRVAIITVIFLIFTPRYFGEIFNNPKDIPFATGYLVALYCIIRWLRNMDTLTWKRTIWLGLAIALAISVRVGGILVIAYLGLFYLVEMYNRKLFGTPVFRKTVIHLVVACVIGWIGACLFWPYALEDIINNPIESVQVMSAYPLNVSTLFDGAKISTTEVPARYLPQWLAIGTPLYILIGFIGSFFFIRKWTKATKDSMYLLLMFATLFPIFYIIYKKSVVYDGMRHILFVLPLISLFAALFYDHVIKMFAGRKSVQYAIAGAVAILVALPARFTFANHPNQYVYFNELTGGIKGAYGNYETDYYFNSLKEGFDWMLEHKIKTWKPSNGKDTLIIASNIPGMVTQYLKLYNGPIKFAYVRYYQRDESDWDYGVFNTRFLDKEQLLNGYFPGDNTIYTVAADGVPLTAVQENDPERNAFKAHQAMKAGSDSLAIPYLNAAVKKYPKDLEAWRNLAIAQFQTGNKAESEAAAAKAYALSSLDLNTANTVGMLYLQGGNVNKAVQVFSKMTDDYPTGAEGWLGLAQAQAASGNFPAAIENVNTALELDGRYAQQGYMIMAYIYQQKGDMASAQRYSSMAQQAQQGR